MKTRTRLIIIISVVVIVAVFFMWKWVFKQADSSVAGKKAEVEISAPALVKAFETNENVANQKYNGKILLVSGIISDVKEDPQFISVYLKDTDATSGVMCSFNKGVVKLKEFKPGEEIKLKGICTGYLMDAVLNKCALE
jgi:hypothetical protein